MSDALSTIADAEKAAAASLLTTLRAQGVADTAELQAFAAEYGPLSVEWGTELVQAKIDKDPEMAQQKQDDLLDLAALAAGRLADMALLAQGTSEQATKDMVTTALTTAAKIGLAALIAA
jgi:hypothetical protein